MNKYLKHNQLGQSLFELVFSLGIVSLVLLTLVSLSTKAVSNSTFAKNSSLAARHNQEVLEWVRSQRDLDWTLFINKVTNNKTVNTTTWCFADLTTPLVSRSPGACSNTSFIPNTQFIRQAVINFIPGPPESVEIISTVKWQDPSGEHDSQATTTLSNWK